MSDQHRAAQAAAARAERREREELFSFHPAILGEAGELPRRSDVSNYRRDREQPASVGDSKGR